MVRSKGGSGRTSLPLFNIKKMNKCRNLLRDPENWIPKTAITWLFTLLTLSVLVVDDWVQLIALLMLFTIFIVGVISFVNEAINAREEKLHEYEKWIGELHKQDEADANLDFLENDPDSPLFWGDR